MDYTKYLENKDFSPSTIKSYQIVANRFNKWLKDQGLHTSQITYNDVTAYINYMQGKRNKQRTIQLEIGALKHYLNYQNVIGNAPKIPIQNLKIQGVKRQHIYTIFTTEELDYIYQSYPFKDYSLSSVEITPIQKRNKIIIGLLVYQGLSTTDIANLKLEHLQLYNGTIEIPPTKRSNGRTLKLEPHQAIEIQRFILEERAYLLKKFDKRTDHLIFNLGISNSIANVLYKLMKNLKTQHPEIQSAKQLRASVITNWLKIHNLRKVQYMAGHRYVSSTENYKINDIATLQNDITQFSPNI